jgi:hypothetical protein
MPVRAWCKYLHTLRLHLLQRHRPAGLHPGVGHPPGQLDSSMGGISGVHPTGEQWRAHPPWEEWWIHPPGLIHEGDSGEFIHQGGND